VLQLLARAGRTTFDATVGTIVVLVRVTLADRVSRERPTSRRVLADGTSSWSSQVSP
jgi:hypothetical protein